MQYGPSHTIVVPREPTVYMPSRDDEVYRNGTWGALIKPRGRNEPPELFLDFGGRIYKKVTITNANRDVFQAIRSPNPTVHELGFDPTGTELRWNGTPLYKQGLPNRIIVQGLPQTRSLLAAFSMNPSDAGAPQIIISVGSDEQAPTSAQTHAFFGPPHDMKPLDVFNVTTGRADGAATVHTKQGTLRWNEIQYPLNREPDGTQWYEGPTWKPEGAPLPIPVQTLDIYQLRVDETPQLMTAIPAAVRTQLLI